MYQRSKTVSTFRNLQRIARVLTSHANGLSITGLQVTVESLGQLGGCDGCFVLRIDENRSSVIVVAEYQTNEDNTPLSGRRFSYKEELLPENLSLTFTGTCAGIAISDGPPSSVLRDFLNACGGRHLLFPIYTNDRLSGFLSLNKSNGEFSTDILELGEAISTEMSTGGAEWQSKKNSEDSIEVLTRQLAIERSARYVMNELHSSLDKNNILQSAVDAVGHLLKASTCMIVRTDGNNPPLVTHEYVRPDISPLGLGDTAHVPPRLVTKFHQRTATLVDTERDDGNSWLGTPLIVNNTHFGLLLVRGDSWRIWQQHEIQLLECIAQSLCVAIANARSYQELREQLFNFKIISNLTQQLTSALDQLQRPPQRPPEVATPETAPVSVPLSPREMEVLKLIAGGLANREIAQRLFLTESTVELHASRIRKKLKLKSRTALVKFACDNNLV